MKTQKPTPAKTQIASQGYCRVSLNLSPHIREQVVERNWSALDQSIRIEANPGGGIFEELQKYEEFSEIEFIISLRSSLVEPDDDGIWHDDGSRVLAFSLSLTLEPALIEGGKLEIRKRSLQPGKSEFIPTPPFGTLIVFATGYQGFEHKINRVIRGERLIIAGWCT